MSKLFISLPGETDYKVYEPHSGGEITFSFVSFDSSRALQLPMSRVHSEVLQWSGQPNIEKVHAPGREEYLQLLSQTIKHIKDRGLGKIVISRPGFFDLKIDPLVVFKKLVEAYPSACVYLFSHPETGTWMGATPELLLKSADGKLKTMSLAGTQRKGEEGHFSEKEEVEQQLVTDYIFSLFKNEPHLEGETKNEPELLAAGNVVHFKTNIEARVKEGFSAEDFLEKLHPTPAVGGFPKEAALEYIHQNEGYDREFYAGYFGLKKGRDFQYFVNLRCMQVMPDSVVLYAGGGVTKDSDPEAEWEETVAKMHTLLSVMQPEIFAR